MFKKGGQGRRLLTMAMFAVPWFFRDQFATTLDEHTKDVHQVLIEKSNHEERQQQDNDQREMRHLLTGIELNQRATNGAVSEERIAEEAAEDWSRSANEEGLSLDQDVETFNTLRSRVDMDDAVKQEMDDIAKRAKTVAETLKAFQYNADATVEDDKKIETLLDDYSKAQEDLQSAWEKLKTAAEKDEEDSSGTATASRFIAWLCTAIGALMIGDWKGFLAGFTGGHSEAA